MFDAFSCAVPRVLFCFPSDRAAWLEYMAVVFTFFETMDELRSVLSKDEVAKFEEVWFSLDRNGTGYIAEWKLPSLLQRSEYHVLNLNRRRACRLTLTHATHATHLHQTSLTPVKFQCDHPCTRSGSTRRNIRTSRTCLRK